jgi:GNAT superfamily N-acetyltransferase
MSAQQRVWTATGRVARITGRALSSSDLAKGFRNGTHVWIAYEGKGQAIVRADGLTPVTWDTPTLLHCYYEQVGPHIAVLDVMMPGEYHPTAAYISRVSVPSKYQGAGVGSRLVSRVCADADALKIALMLVPRPYGRDGEIEHRELVSWYRRFGFADVPHRTRYEGHMLREPHPHEDDMLVLRPRHAKELE